MSSRYDLLFGKLAVKEGLVPPDTVEEANSDLAHRLSSGETVYLWTVMTDNGILSQRQVSTLLGLMRDSIRECPKCQKYADLRSKRGDPKAGCSRCGGPLLALKIPGVPAKPDTKVEMEQVEVDADQLLPDEPESGDGADPEATEIDAAYGDEGSPKPTPKDAPTKRYGGAEKPVAPLGMKKVSTAIKQARTEPAGPPAKGGGGRAGAGKGGAPKKPAAQELTCPICDHEFKQAVAPDEDRVECPKCHSQFEPK